MRASAWAVLLSAVVAGRSAAVGLMFGLALAVGAGSGIGIAAIFLIAAFLSFGPIVLRALFVRADLATATALTATVFVGVLAGEKENGVSSGLFFPKRL